jgi:ATP-binding cassette subfamily C protein/ATP-binding cassette subfamily C protein EexD
MGVLDLFRSRILTKLGIWVDRKLSPLVFARSLENTLRAIPYRTEALRDLATVRAFFSGPAIAALFDAPWMPIYLLFIFLLHPLLGVVALIGAALLLALATTNYLTTADRLKSANTASTKAYEYAEAASRNAEVIDGMGMTPALTRRWEGANYEVLQLTAGAADNASLINACTKSLRLILQVAILGVGAWLVLHEELTAGAMVAGSIIMSRALAPVEQAIASWKQTMSARDAARRISMLFELSPLRPAAMPLPQPRGYLSVEEVSYTPTGLRHPVLRGVSLFLNPGQSLAVLGPSAAGKSTLARLIVGLAQPQHGSIRLDGADVFAWSRDQFGSYVGYLPQDVELFPGTVRENIARMEGGDPSHVVAAAVMAGVHDLILRLPNAYDTEIGEQGALLSGGQRQLIGLARALYGSPTLLVLDEPNSNLDARGDEALNRALAIMKGRGSTVVVIAHRPSIMAQIDQLLVLNDGQMQLMGPRDSVLAQLSRPARSTGSGSVRIVKG